MTQLETLLQCYRTIAPLSRDEERAAFTALRNGDLSQVDRIARANIRFVISIAKPYLRNDVSLADLVASGCVGLLRSIGDFDHTQGFKFITYAVWWTRQQILFDFPQLRLRNPVRRPVSVDQLAEQSVAACTVLEQELQRAPTYDEIFDRIETTTGKPVTCGMRERLLDTRFEPLRLDDPVFDHDEATYHDRLANNEDLHAQLEADELAYHLADLIGTLPEREQKIIRSYFGFDGPRHTIEEIGTQIGVTRERVRQIKERAVEKLRHRAEYSALTESIT